MTDNNHLWYIALFGLVVLTVYGILFMLLVARSCKELALDQVAQAGPVSVETELRSKPLRLSLHTKAESTGHLAHATRLSADDPQEMAALMGAQSEMKISSPLMPCELAHTTNCSIKAFDNALAELRTNTMYAQMSEELDNDISDINQLHDRLKTKRR